MQAGLCSGVRGDPIHAGEQPHAEVRLDRRVRQSPHGLPVDALRTDRIVFFLAHSFNPKEAGGVCVWMAAAPWLVREIDVSMGEGE